MVASALIQAVGSLGSAGISAGGASAMNERSYHYNMNLQKQAQRWQERMSNTAHQREVEDLRLAGINPLYTATGGNGASTGSVGANSFHGNVPDLGNTFLSGMATFSNIKNQTNATNADVVLKNTEVQGLLSEMQERLVRMEEIKARTDLTRAKRKMIDSQINQIKANIRHLDTASDLNITNSSLLGRRDKYEREHPGLYGANLFGDKLIQGAGLGLGLGLGFLGGRRNAYKSTNMGFRY